MHSHQKSLLKKNVFKIIHKPIIVKYAIDLRIFTSNLSEMTNFQCCTKNGTFCVIKEFRWKCQPESIFSQFIRCYLDIGSLFDNKLQFESTFISVITDKFQFCIEKPNIFISVRFYLTYILRWYSYLKCIFWIKVWKTYKYEHNSLHLKKKNGWTSWKYLNSSFFNWFSMTTLLSQRVQLIFLQIKWITFKIKSKTFSWKKNY